MRPDHNNRSVPVLIPLQAMWTTTSLSCGGNSATSCSESSSGRSMTTAMAFILGSLVPALTDMCHLKFTIMTVKHN